MKHSLMSARFLEVLSLTYCVHDTHPWTLGRNFGRATAEQNINSVHAYKQRSHMVRLSRPLAAPMHGRNGLPSIILVAGPA
jgi:hypothetical protein